MINVTKTFLPPIEEYTEKLKTIWETHWVTNIGPMTEELEKQLKKYLGVRNLLLVSNGTIALQLAIKSLELKDEIITTPFSYVATTNSILWENCRPVFCDIENENFCIDADQIENFITEKTSAILPTHVYGFPCNFEKIKSIAEKHNLKVIYDGAHAFGVKSSGKSLLSYGDVSTVSFHATKIFHTIEGGAIITEDDKLAEKLFLHRAFGHLEDDYITIGINARTSEFNAAMGLCNLPYIDELIKVRKGINLKYRNFLQNTLVSFPSIPNDIEYNYAYFPVLFESEEILLSVKNRLAADNIFARRYFYPSLNTISFVQGNKCPVSEDIAKRILCLPNYHDLKENDIEKISSLVNKTLL